MVKIKNRYTVIKSNSEDSLESLDINTFIELPKEEVIDIKNTVIRDSREKNGHGWYFEKSDLIEGMERGCLETGDYTLKGLEKDFVVERKGSTAEFSQNILQKRFEREMERLESFKYGFIVCEFSFEDLVNFPINSGIPPRFWSKVKLTPKFLISAYLRYQVQYRTKIILAGENAQETVLQLFKLVTHYDKQNG